MIRRNKMMIAWPTLAALKLLLLAAPFAVASAADNEGPVHHGDVGTCAAFSSLPGDDGCVLVRLLRV